MLKYLFVLTLFIWMPDKKDCTCSLPESPEISESEIDSYNLIILGIAKKIDNYDVNYYKVTFLVTDGLKGAANGSSIEVLNPKSNCGLDIDIEEEWFIAGYKHKRKCFETNQCERSKEYDPENFFFGANEMETIKKYLNQ
jgi:hypothetical protein